MILLWQNKKCYNWNFNVISKLATPFYRSELKGIKLLQFWIDIYVICASKLQFNALAYGKYKLQVLYIHYDLGPRSAINYF